MASKQQRTKTDLRTHVDVATSQTLSGASQMKCLEKFPQTRNKTEVSAYVSMPFLKRPLNPSRQMKKSLKPPVESDEVKICRITQRNMTARTILPWLIALLLGVTPGTYNLGRAALVALGLWKAKQPSSNTSHSNQQLNPKGKSPRLLNETSQASSALDVSDGSSAQVSPRLSELDGENRIE